MALSRNQYSAPASIDDFVAHLLTRRTEAVWDDLHAFECLRPCGPGISRNAGGYMRVNFGGGKIVVHKTVLECIRGPAPDTAPDASHLCGNEWCCNPKHLEWESRADNIARRGCAGFVLVDGTGWVKVCKHRPPCTVSSTGASCAKPT